MNATIDIANSAKMASPTDIFMTTANAATKRPMSFADKVDAQRVRSAKFHADLVKFHNENVIKTGQGMFL